MRVTDELKQHYRVLAPDLPGFGRSKANDGFSGSLNDYSIFVQRFCNALNLRNFYIYVNDSSGTFGLHAASKMKDQIAGVIIADTVALPIPSLVKFILRYVVNSSLVRFLNRRWNLLPWMVATLAPLKKPFTKADRELMVSQFDTSEKRDRILNLFLSMAIENEFVDDVVSQERAISDRPALLLFGQFDPMRFVGSITKFKEMFSKTTLSIIPYEEHFPILSSGKEVAQEVHQWIQKQKSLGQ